MQGVKRGTDMRTDSRIIHSVFVACLLVAAAGQADAATFTVTPDSVNRLTYVSATPTTQANTVYYNGLFSTWLQTGNMQRTLLATSTTTFEAALLAQLGPLGAGQSYQINSAVLTAGDLLNDYTDAATAHQVLVDYATNTVTWNNFNNGGVAGVQYSSAASATSVPNFTSSNATWNLTSDVQDWLSGGTNKGLIFISVGDTAGPPTFTDYNRVAWTLNAEIATLPPAIELDGLSTGDSVDEGLPSGTHVGSFAVVNTNTTFSYSLVETGTYPDNGSFTLTGGSFSNLETAAVFDYATKSTYSIRVLATEDAPGTLLLTNTFTITVNQVWDGVIAGATDGGSTNDVLDHSRGTVVSATDSLFGAGVVASDMIGTTNSSPGPGTTIFSDSVRIEDRAWLRTSGPVALTGYRVRISEDGDGSGNRGATNFLFEASSNGVDYVTLDNVTLAAPYTANYGNYGVAVSNSVSMAPARFFRVTLKRSVTTRGVRLVELDGFGVNNYQDFFADTFTGASGSATAPASLATPATTASAKVSDYIVDSGNVGIASGGGNPAPHLNIFTANSGGETNALHLNLATIKGATYSVFLEASMWGADSGTRSYTLSASAFDGTDTTSGSALGSGQIVQPSASFTMKTISFTFVAASTGTTLYLYGTIVSTVSHDVWIDNLDINEDLSTVPPSGTVFLIN